MTDGRHHCTGDLDAHWSGNFLNWAAMARIDVVRKILFGGHRRVDTATEQCSSGPIYPTTPTVGPSIMTAADIQDLTPFVRGVDYDCDQGNLAGCRDANGNPGERKDRHYPGQYHRCRHDPVQQQIFRSVTTHRPC